MIRNMKHIINKLSALILMLMCVSATVQAEMVSHAACDPTYGTLGFTRECWEDTENGKFYADEARTQELTGLALAKAITYAKLPENPIYTNYGNFSCEETEHLAINGENLDLNWAVSTTFNSSSFLMGDTRSIQFKVKGHVCNARIVWFSEINQRDYDYYNVTITVKRGSYEPIGKDFSGRDANGFFVYNLGSELKDGDIVEFSVKRRSGNSGYSTNTTFKASLEYTFINESDIVHHITCAPTLTSRGFTRECWENKITGQIYADADLTQEIVDKNLAQAVTYLPLRENPSGNISEFYKSNYDRMFDVDMYWNAFCEYKYEQDNIQSTPRYAEFKVTADNVSSARLVLYKNQQARENTNGSGAYVVKVYVNNVGKYYKEIPSSDGIVHSSEAIYVVPLLGLKKGDIVKFQVVQTYRALYGDYLRASLEYIGKFENDDYLVYQPIQEPTLGNFGVTRDFWKNTKTDKYYTNAACYEEIDVFNIEKIIRYLKLPESPIVETNGFNESQYGNIRDVDFNWAGVTKYGQGLNSTPRWVKFKASTTKENHKIVNARLVWDKELADYYDYGKYSIDIYVNEKKVYNKTPGRFESFEGLSFKRLPDLKKDDIVRFEVKQSDKGKIDGSTFYATLEYNVVPCTEHEYPVGSAVCSLCGYVKPHEHTYNETEICSQCGYVDPLYYIVMPGNVGKVNAEDIKWELNRYNVLTYTGTGEMEDFNADHNEWRNENKNVVTKLVIGEGITKIGDSGTNGYFDQMSNLADVYLMGDQKVSAANDAFDDDVNNVTLHVDKSLLRWANATSPWNRFGTILPLDNTNIKYIDASDNTQGVYLNPKASDNAFTLTDGCKQLAIYEDIPMQTLTYKRNFSAANTWQALYVPFEMEYNDWADNFDVAAISNFHEYTNNGVTESIELEVRYVKSGKLRANTPYLIRAKEAGVQEIVLNDVTLMATESKSIDCSSTERIYTFTGTYDAIDKLQSKDYIFLSGGRLSKSGNDTDVLKPMRWYLTIKNYFSVTGDATYALAKSMRIRLIDDDETTDIMQLENGEWKNSTDIYNLNGMRLSKPQKGINIINGKKIIVK